MLSRSSFRSAFNRTSHLSTIFLKISLFPELRITSHGFRCTSVCYHTCLVNRPLLETLVQSPVSNRKSNLSCIALAAAASTQETTELSVNTSTRRKKKERDVSPKFLLKVKLDQCARSGNLHEALCLYDEARGTNIKLDHEDYNKLLYLCSLAASSAQPDADAINEKSADLGLKRGFEIYHQMVIDEVAPNEATFTNAARLAVASEDPELAFNLVKKMKTCNIPPRLRSYEPALLGFCKKGLVDKAYEVDSHMVESGVMPEEPELSALLKLSADNNKADKVYELLHRLRANIRQVTEPTARIIADWFESEDAAKIRVDDVDVTMIRQGIIRGGGGWHGQGWLGSGKWEVVRTGMDDSGVCHSCGQKLACIDIDKKERENFATSLSNLACQKEKTQNFLDFKEWLQRHGPFDAVIDGANMGLNRGKNFSFNRLNTIVNRLRHLSPSKRLPLVVLHISRVTGGPAKHPDNKRLIEKWKASGALYVSPAGSNDDWYWLYAAVSSKCLLVTNDEMRDHLFQLLGTSFFPRWKEKHQVRISYDERLLKLHMPPPYSIVIQESENGNWHVPMATGDDLESPRQWLCCTRSKNN